MYKKIVICNNCIHIYVGFNVGIWTLHNNNIMLLNMYCILIYILQIREWGKKKIKDSMYKIIERKKIY